VWNCSSQITSEGCAAIGDAIVASGSGLRWSAMVRPEGGWTPDRIERTARGGGTTFNFGVETFVPRLSRLMRKGVNLRTTTRDLREFRRHDVAVTLYTLMNYPTETLDEYREHLRTLESEVDAFDNIFKSIFMLVADAPALGDLAELGIPVPTADLESIENSDFPYYMIPNGRETGHYSSGYAFRWPGDRLEEKDDAYHRMWLRLINREPWYFDRHLEIATRQKWWQPEYVMIERAAGGVRRLPGYSLPEMLSAQFSLAPDIEFERLSDHLAVLRSTVSPTAFYLGAIDSTFIERVIDGSKATEAFGEVLERYHPTAEDVVALYHTLHGRLRQVGLLEISIPDRDARELALAEVNG
jgi:hypothetical protein